MKPKPTPKPKKQPATKACQVVYYPAGLATVRPSQHCLVHKTWAYREDSGKWSPWPVPCWSQIG